MTEKKLYLIVQSVLCVLLVILLSVSAVSTYRTGKAQKAEDPMASIYTREKAAEKFKPIAPLFFGAIGMTVAGWILEVKDDDAAEAIKSRIVRGADGGLENGSLVGVMGTQDSPDFIVLGDFRHFEDVGGVHTYRMRLAIHSLTTGKIVWEGIQSKVKL